MGNNPLDNNMPIFPDTLDRKEMNEEWRKVRRNRADIPKPERSPAGDWWREDLDWPDIVTTKKSRGGLGRGGRGGGKDKQTPTMTFRATDPVMGKNASLYTDVDYKRINFETHPGQGLPWRRWSSPR